MQRISVVSVSATFISEIQSEFYALSTNDDQGISTTTNESDNVLLEIQAHFQKIEVVDSTKKKTTKHYSSFRIFHANELFSCTDKSFLAIWVC